MKIEHTTVMIDKSLDDAIMDLKRREKIKNDLFNSADRCCVFRQHSNKTKTSKNV